MSAEEPVQDKSLAEKVAILEDKLVVLEKILVLQAEQMNSIAEDNTNTTIFLTSFKDNILKLANKAKGD